MQEENTKKYVFLEVWERIKDETPIKNLTKLADTIGTTQQNVSRQKKEGSFPPGWAYTVGKKYGLLTEWIMTGEGPKRLGDATAAPDQKATPRGIIEEWLQDVRKKEGHDGRIVREMTKKFPEFDEWCEREKKNQNVEAEIGSPRENIA